MGLETSAEQWFAKVAVKKVVWGVAKGLAGILAYQKAQSLETTLGIKIDPNTFQNGLATLAFGGLAALHDYLALKYPNLANWL